MMIQNVYSNFVKHISYPLIARYNGFEGLYRELTELEVSQYDSADKIHECQLIKLRLLLQHAYNTTRYYRRLFDQCGFNPDQFRHADQLEVIPVLTKDTIRENLTDLISNRFASSELHHSETGGTSGIKMKFYRNNSCLTRKEAALLRFERWSGWDFGDPLGVVWPAQQDYVGHWTRKAKLKNALYQRQVVFPAALVDEASILEYLSIVNRYRPTILRAFTSPLYEISKVIIKKSVPVTKIKGIVTTGEPLYQHQRALIEKAFGCKVFDSYRSREAGPIAQECEVHKGLHLNAENLFVEIISINGLEPDDKNIGEIIVTDLLNFGMPLIRYNMGDLGIISDEKCACGRGLPILNCLRGRSASSFITPDGKIVASGALVLYLVDEAPGPLGQVQIVQEKIDKLTIRMTKNPIPSNKIMDYQRRTIDELFGPNMIVDFEFVDKIDREPSGKYLFTKCLCDWPEHLGSGE